MRESITIIVPTFNEEKSLRECFHALNELTLEISKIGLAKICILFSDNFSSDDTWQMLRNACEKNISWDAVQLDRNYGIQASLLKAMSISRTDSVLIFQSDLQDPIDAAVDLVKKWRDGADVVVGLTETRSENFLDRFGRSLFYKILTKTVKASTGGSSKLRTRPN